MEPKEATETLRPPGGPTAFGKYQLFASLGRGGMADVFLAVARGPMGFNKLVVIKRLRTALAEEPSFLNMFLDEARLAARLNHPNVVHTYEVGEQNQSYFIAMEYLEGQSLNKIIKELTKTNEDLDQSTCARIISDALAGLHHAHELRDYDGTPLQIIHRDISPHNVFVTYEGQIKLVDFGIAKAALSSTQTEVGVLKGKVAYMAPEQAMGGAIDRRADIFGMGIVLWELLTRKRLMSGESAAATLHRLLNAPIPRVSTLIESIDPALDEIVAKALEKDADRRYQTAQEMREALEAWIVKSGHGVRQEDIGRRISVMFKQLREDVQRQVQTHMHTVGNAATTQELAALNVDSIRRLGGSGGTQSSGQLLALGTGSGSGSGVVAVEGAAAAADPEKKKGRGAILFALIALVLAGVGLLIFKLTSSSSGPNDVAQNTASTAPTQAQTATANPARTDQSPTATTSAPIATTAPTPTLTAPTATVSETATATVPTATSTTKKPPWALPPHPTATTTTTATTAPTTTKSVEPTSTAPPEATGPGFLTLDTVPWTRVSADGRSLGSTPIIGVPLSPGAHGLSLDNPGEGIHTAITVMIKSGEQTRIRRVLKN